MATRKFLYILTIIIIALIFLNSLCIRTERRTQLAMGTLVDIKLTGFVWDDFDRAFKNAFEAIGGVEGMANLYDSESELSRLNKSSRKMPSRLSEELFYMIYNSNIICDESNGAFDITVSPLAILWKSHIKNKSVPNKRDIKQALSFVGSDKLVLDQEHRTVFFKKKGMNIDLGAAAKGYAVDKAVYEIKRANFRSAMINAGGDVFCLGKRRFIFPWRVGIRDPYNKDDIYKVLNISNRAAATSGGYEQFFLHEDKYYSHLIDPKTGYPVNNTFSSVTVIADSCFMADAIATAIFVGGQPIKDKLEILYPKIRIIVIEK